MKKKNLFLVNKVDINSRKVLIFSLGHSVSSVPRFTGKTRITRKTAKIPERLKN